jgi:hypothetical protein
MSLELLLELASQPLPVQISDVGKMGEIRQLRADGDVIVLLPTGDGLGQYAIVLLITAHGWRRLRGDPRPGL